MGDNRGKTSEDPPPIGKPQITTDQMVYDDVHPMVDIKLIKPIVGVYHRLVYLTANFHLLLEALK